jgi:hypothetical protein
VGLLGAGGSMAAFHFTPTNIYGRTINSDLQNSMFRRGAVRVPLISCSEKDLMIGAVARRREFLR